MNMNYKVKNLYVKLFVIALDSQNIVNETLSEQYFLKDIEEKQTEINMSIKQLTEKAIKNNGNFVIHRINSKIAKLNRKDRMIIELWYSFE